MVGEVRRQLFLKRARIDDSEAAMEKKKQQGYF
jgi:hypothetical protein